MNRRHQAIIGVLGVALFFGAQFEAPAQVVITPAQEADAIFGGGQREIFVQIQNKSSQDLAVTLSVKLSQASSTTVAPLREFPWKQLRLLSDQTVLDSLQMDFPVVWAETRFLLQWIDGGSNVLGQTKVLVYPTNLLAQLKALVGEEPLGVFDPTAELSPLLRTQAVEFVDLVETGTDKFHGKLAIVGPFASKAQMRASLRNDIRALAKRGVAVVWLQPPAEKFAPLKPTFYVVREGGSAVVVAPPDLTARLAERPEAQLNLIRLAEEALQPRSWALPETETEN